MHPQEIFKETQASKLGDAPMHPLLHQQLSVRLSFHYIFITSCIMCYTWSVSLLGFIFSFIQLCLMFITIQNPAFFVWERNTLHFQNLEHDIGLFMLIFAVCVLYLFHSYCHVQLLVFMLIFLKSFLFNLLMELYLVFMFILFREFACCTEFCVLT